MISCEIKSVVKTRVYIKNINITTINSLSLQEQQSLNKLVSHTYSRKKGVSALSETFIGVFCLCLSGHET